MTTPRKNTLAALLPYYTHAEHLCRPFTKPDAVRAIVAGRLRSSAGYFHHESVTGCGNRARRRAKLLSQ